MAEHLVVIATNQEQRRTQPDNDWVRAVCRINQGKKCCYFLTFGPHGYSCEKGSSLGVTLALRAGLGMMTAQGDNCEGRASRIAISAAQAIGRPA